MKRFEKKTHYKMYKTHKGWLVAGVTVTTMAMGIFAGPQAVQTAQADTTPQTESTSESSAEQSSEVTLPKTPTSGSKEDASSATENSTADKTVPAGTQEKTMGSVASDGTTTDKQVKETSPDTKNKAANPNGMANGKSTKTATQTPVVESASVGNETSLQDDSETTAAKQATAAVGITIQKPADLTDPVTGKADFNNPKTAQNIYTYDHTSNGISSDLRLVNGFSKTHQVQGMGNWVGETYASNIAQTAKGQDVNSPLIFSDNSHPLYIDEWMPDSGLQYQVWQNSFSSKFSSFADFRNNFTKADLATVTRFSTNELAQSVGGKGVTETAYYQSLMSMKTLEGLQNATNLTSIYLYPDPSIGVNNYGGALRNGNLWDIRALASLNKLTDVTITMFSVTDISALGNKPALTNVDLPYNQITDISPLTTDKNLDINKHTSLGNQHVVLSPITLNSQLTEGMNQTADGTISYTTPSFIIKDLNAANLPIKGFNNAEGDLYPMLWPSTADTGNVNSNTLTWYNLKANPSDKYGNLSMLWADPDSSFAGYIIQPYDLDPEAVNLTVSIQLLQPDGQQLDLGPATTLSGKIGQTVNIQADPSVQTMITTQLQNGYSFSNLVLDGTGLYSDYVANNGLANNIGTLTPTLGAASSNVTLLFYKNVLPWNVSVNYGYQQPDGTIKAITDEKGQPISQGLNTTSDQKILTSSLIKDFPDYVYQGVYTSSNGQSLDTNISNAIDVPFLTAKQPILVVYAQAKRATVLVKDATTGQTLQTLDYTNTPSLRGAIGTTSDFDSASVTTPALQNGYVIVSDTTKQADGTSAITFAATNAANTDYTITLAHGFKTTQKAVNETITYQDLTQTPVQPATTHQAVFATVTDQVTKDAVTYSQLDPQTTLTPDTISGQPTDKNWTVYSTDGAVTLAAVANPTIANMHVVATTDPAGKLTEIAAQAVTPDSQDLAFTVTYAHDFTTTTKQVTEGITYLDQTGKPVAAPVNQTVTFATVTDAKTGQQTVYNAFGATQTPVLDDNGVPTDAAWTTGGQATFAAVANPTVTGMHVVTTTDPAQDLTQTTAKQVTSDGQNLAFTVTYAHEFTTTAKQVTEGITYVDQAGQVVADPVTQTFTFVTVTDQSNQHQVTYSTPADTSTPALDSQGVPTGLDWTTYQTGDQLTFAAVKNPAVTGMHVVGTTDPAKDLTQITAQTVTSDGPDRTFTLTYAHDFKTTLNQVTEGITYVDQTGKSVANPVTKTITFATVTDQSNQKQTVYSTPAVAQTPTLDDNGVPTDQQTWTVYQTGDQLTFAAVTNPKVTGMHVVATTDPAKDLTQTTAQAVTNASPNLTFVVTYDADATTGGGGDTGDNGGDDNNGGGTTTNPGDNNGGGTTTNPGDNGNGGDSGNNGGNTVTPPTTAPTIDGNGNDGDQGVPLKPAKKPAQLVTAGDANLASGGTPVKGSTAQPDGTTTLVAHGQADKGQVMAAAKAMTTTLPQTSEQPQNSLAVLGLTLLGALAGLVGLKKHQN